MLFLKILESPSKMNAMGFTQSWFSLTSLNFNTLSSRNSSYEIIAPIMFLILFLSFWALLIYVFPWFASLLCILKVEGPLWLWPLSMSLFTFLFCWDIYTMGLAMAFCKLCKKLLNFNYDGRGIYNSFPKFWRVWHSTSEAYVCVCVSIYA